MSKTKYCLLGSIIISLIIVGGVLFLMKSELARAQETTSTTFPVDEAGIAAYVKVDNINVIDKDALAEAFKTIEKSGESYVIGRVPVTNKPLVYVGLDGWIVAYFSKDEPASKIAGGKKATTLENAIDYMCEKTGLTYSTSAIKYYDFEFPEANKMTLIKENVNWDKRRNSFYVTVPGTLYEGSYRVYVGNAPYSCSLITLTVDEVSVFEKSVGQSPTCPIQFWWGAPLTFYGYYDPPTYFETGVTHFVTFSGYIIGSSATVLIYKN